MLDKSKVRKYILKQFGNNIVRFGRNVDFGISNRYGNNPSEVIDNMAYDIFLQRDNVWNVMGYFGYTRESDLDDTGKFSKIITTVGVQLYNEYRKKDPYSKKDSFIYFVEDEYPKVAKQIAYRILKENKSLKYVYMFKNGNSLKPKAVVTKSAKGIYCNDGTNKGYLNPDGSFVKR